MTTIMYGIPNCDTIKKAQKWLNENNIPCSFHDYRKDGLTTDLLTQLLLTSSWDQLLNKRSASYRALTEQQKESLNENTANALFIEFPTFNETQIETLNELFKYTDKDKNADKIVTNIEFSKYEDIFVNSYEN